ncbi:MAG: SRPBCC domain-containing protein [Ignavibacteriales bacterium]|nr:SRPBCC domain-containing protein [Ignavibacteriales bacterium]
MRSVHSTIEINISPNKVLDAFTEFDLLKDWWGVERALIEKQNGGVYTLAWGITDAGFKYISSGTIDSYQPGNHLEIVNLVYLNAEKPPLGPMSLLIRVKPHNHGTLLDLTQDGYQSGETWDWYYEAVRKAWPAVLLELKKYLEKKEQERA